MDGITEMTNYHFKYSGEVVITAETYEEAEEQLKHMLRGVFSYHQIHHSVGMLADFDDEDETEND
jgi:ssRNA-specific RNase YbeY (16S rRNA maturation enzyme)